MLLDFAEGARSGRLREIHVMVQSCLDRGAEFGQRRPGPDHRDNDKWNERNQHKRDREFRADGQPREQLIEIHGVSDPWGIDRRAAPTVTFNVAAGTS